MKIFLYNKKKKKNLPDNIFLTSTESNKDIKIEFNINNFCNLMAMENKMVETNENFLKIFKK